MGKREDPVRLYLREMGSVPLLTREGEVAIAKRIERGQLRVMKTLSRSPLVLKALLVAGEELRAGARTIKDIVQFDSEELTDKKIERKTRDTLELIAQIAKLYERALNQAARLERVTQSNKRGLLRAQRQLARTLGRGSRCHSLRVPSVSTRQKRSG
jgi:RNA polymerase primary sigma factor